MQERRNSIANALELRLSCTNPSICSDIKYPFLLPSTVDSGHNPLILTVRDAHDPLGQISVPLSSLPGYRTNRTTKAALQPHRKCPNPQGELLYEAWVSKHGAALHHNHLSLDSDSDSGHKGGTFGRIKDTFRPHSPLAKRKSPIFGRKKINQTQEPEPGRLGRRRHSSLSDLTKLHEQWEKAGVKDHAIIHENGIKNLAFAPFALMAPLDNNKRTSSHVDLTRDELDKPSISGISPNQGPISGGTRITIRGRNLGVDKADVVGLHICGANCLGSLEYESASKLYVTTKAWKPVKGLITVVTQSGGKGSSLVEFTFIDPKVPLVNGAKPRLSRSNSVGDLKGSENDRKVRLPYDHPGPRFNIKNHFPGICISLIKITQSWGRFILMWIPIPVRHHCTETDPMPTFYSDRCLPNSPIIGDNWVCSIWKYLNPCKTNWLILKHLSVTKND